MTRLKVCGSQGCPWLHLGSLWAVWLLFLTAYLSVHHGLCPWDTMQVACWGAEALTVVLLSSHSCVPRRGVSGMLGLAVTLAGWGDAIGPSPISQHVYLRFSAEGKPLEDSKFTPLIPARRLHTSGRFGVTLCSFLDPSEVDLRFTIE